MDQSQMQSIANQNGVSIDAVTCLWNALIRGNGTMAQFSHYELGGTGQWMLGGMTMVGDMFNYNAKARVDNICNALSEAARQAAQEQFAAARSVQQQSSGDATNFISMSSGSWWSNELGVPSSVGSQNDSSYAFFPSSHRLAIKTGNKLTVYDTLDHMISGVSQQQGGSDALTFSSQYGTIRVSDLPVVSGDGAVASAAVSEPTSAPQMRVDAPSDDPVMLLERLGKLRDAGVLTDEEFAAKKAELLSRI